jgi:hypothetical protein
MNRLLLVRRALTAGAIGAIVLATAPMAAAADGKWTQVSDYTNAKKYPQMSSIDAPTMARFGSEVQILWSNDTGPLQQQYSTAIVNGAGKVVAGPSTAFGGWSALAHNPALISLNGQRFLGFSGLQSTTTGAPYTSGAEYYATSGDGRAWSLGAGSLSATQSAYASYSNDVVDNAGTPVWIGSASSTSGINWHVGISPSDPAPEGSDGQFRLDGCCAYDGATERDAATGAVWAAFYSNSSASNEQGIQVGQIVPFAGGFAQAPGSVKVTDGAANSTPPAQRVAMAARAGGGVYVAYPVGYPTATGIKVLKVGTSQVLDIPAYDAGNVTMSADPAGRLWISWEQGGKVKAVHTNTAGTALGAVGSFGKPKGADSVWHSTSSAEAGGLDVAYTFTVRNAINVWHTHLLRTLSVDGPKTAGRGSNVTFTVSDAGDPVAGARVSFGGRSGTTNAQGKVTLRASGGSGVRAAKAGYNTGSANVRVR